MTEIKFYLGNSTTLSPVLSGIVSDQRNYLDILLECTQPSIFSSAQVFIAKQSGNTITDSSPIGYPMKLGNNYIGNPDVVGTNEIAYMDAEGNGKFVDNTRYTIKIKVFMKGDTVYGNTGSTLTYFPKYGADSLSVYSFLYRADGGDQFSDEIQDPVNPELYEPVCKVTNETLIEGGVGFDILVKAPIHFANSNDTRTPNNLTFTFDEVNNYEGTENDSSNVEQLSYYSVNVPYDASGNYTLPQTGENYLENDKGYYINVMAIYSDGYTVSKTFYLVLHVIERPVVQSVVAYGIAPNQSDADELLISSVMNVYMNPYSYEQVNLPSSTDTVTFNLSQGGVVMYKAEMPLNFDDFLYTVLKEDIVKVWTTTAPTQESNGSYQYDVTANILHYTLYENEFIPKASAAFPRTFTSDIVPLPSVVALNAWVAASNVAGTGHRTVDISDATTAAGYNLAPELGIVGKFSKNDFYGSGITDGFFKDLDAVDASGNAVTNHKFTVSVNGTSKTVTALHQIQGHSDKTDQEMYMELFTATPYTSDNGSFRNLPGPAGVLGSVQKPIYFFIPSTDLFNQTDSVKVSIAIEPRAGETTRPSATESDAQIIVAKVNTYVMTVGTASEPEFKDGTLTVPINNASTLANEYYFESAIFTSDNAAPNDVKEVSSSNGGVFNILVVNPSIRGANCNYQVRYKITDPNAENGSITGPISATYSIALFNEPGLDNFNVTNFSYDTFNNNAVSKFKFDIQFLTVDSRTVDGVYVYFKSTNNDEDASNDIPLTELMVVSKTTGETQTNLSYTLQNTAAANAGISEGIKIVDKLGADSMNKWLNFRSGEIVFKPYKGSTVQTVQTARTVYNVPSIPMPTNLTLTGGVIESYDATKVAWDNALSAYASVSSAVNSSYKLVLNTSDVSGQVANAGYTIDLSSYAAGDAVTLTLQLEITTAIDSLSYLSNSVVLDFVVASVDTYELSTIVVKRGSNQSTLKVTRGDSVIAPLNGATVTEVKLIDNVNPANTNPAEASVKVLTCSSTQADVQPADPTVNEYNLVTDGYVLGDDVDMQYRAKAFVSYNVKYGSAAAVPLSSTPLYLTLQYEGVKYVVATNPDTLIGPSYRRESSGTYAGRIAVNVNINANGLHAEGLQSAVFILAQEGDMTNLDGSDQGIQYMIAFESTDGLTKSYIVGPNASLLPSSTDNLGASEVQQVDVVNVDGLVGGSTTSHTLVVGNLLSSDQSTLYLDATSGFNVTLPITVVAVVSTRLGSAVSFKEMTPSALLSNFSVPSKMLGDAPFALTAPQSNSDGAFTYSSSNPAVATVSGSNVTIIGGGTTTFIATQAATATYASNSISATFTVTLPPISLNGMTIQYNSNAADVPTSSALFIEANPRGTGLEWFAVVKDGMKTAITAYASGTNGPFIPSGQSVPVPFNNIVTTLMTNFIDVFSGKTTFNQPISSWDTANVTNMSYMFYQATVFNQPIGSWNTAKVTNMGLMFTGPSAFNQPIDSWNTANVTNMYGMFYSATAFNQNISGWNVNLANNYDGFRDGSALSTENTPLKFR